MKLSDVNKSSVKSLDIDDLEEVARRLNGKLLIVENEMLKRSELKAKALSPISDKGY